MKCIILTAGATPVPSHSTPLLPLASLIDRSFLQHLVETLVEAGARELHVISEGSPERVEDLLSDGTRWGVAIRHHLTDPDRAPYATLANIAGLEDGETVVLADASAIVSGAPLASALRDGAYRLYCNELPVDPAQAWTGWAVVPASVLRAAASGADRAAVFASLAHDLGARATVHRGTWLRAGSHAQLLAANRAVLDSRAPALQLLGRLDAHGVRLARGVRVHETARVIGPAFLGPDVEIGAGCVIGPHAVIGEATIVDRDTAIRDSIVEAHLYVGCGLELNGQHLLAGTLYDTKLDVDVSIADPAIADSLSAPWFADSAQAVAGRALALGILAVAAPLLALMKCRAGAAPLLSTTECVATPHTAGSAAWKSVRLHRFAPDVAAASKALLGARLFAALERLVCGALDVWYGRLAWVGATPRTAADLARLPEGDRAVLLSVRCGVFSESDRVAGLVGTPPDARQAEIQSRFADLHYLSAHGLRRDCQLVLQSLWNPVEPALPEGSAHQTAPQS